MASYVVTDERNYWLAYGEFASWQEAYEEARYATDYAPGGTIYIFEVCSERTIDERSDSEHR
jgi:hypothetical protein